MIIFLSVFWMPILCQRASTSNTQPRFTVLLSFRPCGNPTASERGNCCCEAIGSMTVSPQTLAMDWHNRTSCSRSSWSTRPKLWMIFATGLRVTGWRSLWASWKYSTLEPSLFLRLVRRRYMLTYLACIHIIVKKFITNCVPTSFGVSQNGNYLNLLDPGWKIGQFEAVFCLHTENMSLFYQFQHA